MADFDSYSNYDSQDDYEESASETESNATPRRALDVVPGRSRMDQDILTKLFEKEHGLSKLFCSKTKGRIFLTNDDFYVLNSKTKIWEKKQSFEVGKLMVDELEIIINELIEKAKIEERVVEANNSESEKKSRGRPEKPLSEKLNDVKHRYLFTHTGTTAMVNKLKPLIINEEIQFNQSFHHLVPIRNGKVLNLITGEIEDGLPEHKFNFYLDVDADLDKDKLKFIDKMMLDICCGNKDLVRYMRTMLGYMLTGETKEQKMFIWYGCGSNGKSTIIFLLKKILSKFYGELPEHLMIKASVNKNKDSDSATPSLIGLKDSRVAILSETSQEEEINDKVVKQITGGEAMIGRQLYSKNMINFQPKFKPVICSNHKPKVNVEDSAIMRRLILFPFNAKFVENPQNENEYPCDKDLTNKLEKDYLNTFFTWMCVGAKRYYDNGFPIFPQIMNREMENFVQDNQDPFMTWFDNYCELDEESKVKGTDLFQNYKNYYLTSQTDRKHKTDRNFYSTLLQKVNCERKIIGKATWFKGLKLKS
jgi:P4 family phage/plasmid primase-like protien